MFNHPFADIVALEFGLVAPFWDISLGQYISEYGTTRPSYVTPIQETTPSDEFFRPVQDNINHLRNI